MESGVDKHARGKTRVHEDRTPHVGEVHKGPRAEYMNRYNDVRAGGVKHGRLWIHPRRLKIDPRKLKIDPRRLKIDPRRSKSTPNIAKTRKTQKNNNNDNDNKHNGSRVKNNKNI